MLKTLNVIWFPLKAVIRDDQAMSFISEDKISSIVSEIEEEKIKKMEDEKAKRAASKAARE